MSFLETTGSALGTAFGGGVGGAVGGVLGNAVGGLFGSSDKPDMEEQVRLGHKYDLQSQKKFYRWKHQYGTKHGMTDYEMFMGPAAGSTGGSTGAGQVLGNSANQQYMQEKQLERSAAIEGAQREMDRQTELEKARIQADASRDVAGINQETTLTVEQWRNAIANRQVSLSEKEYEEITKPLAAKNMAIKEMELELITNQVATSTPEWERWRLMQQMGVDNMLVSAISNRLGINVTDQKQMQGLSEEKFEKLITLALSAQSYTRKEVEGILGLLRGYIEPDDYPTDAKGFGEMTKGAVSGSGAASLGKPRPAAPSGKYRGSSFTAPDNRRRKY